MPKDTAAETATGFEELLACRTYMSLCFSCNDGALHFDAVIGSRAINDERPDAACRDPTPSVLSGVAVATSTQGSAQRRTVCLDVLMTISLTSSVCVLVVL